MQPVIPAHRALPTITTGAEDRCHLFGYSDGLNVGFSPIHATCFLSPLEQPVFCSNRVDYMSLDSGVSVSFSIGWISS